MNKTSGTTEHHYRRKNNPPLFFMEHCFISAENAQIIVRNLKGAIAKSEAAGVVHESLSVHKDFKHLEQYSPTERSLLSSINECIKKHLWRTIRICEPLDTKEREDAFKDLINGLSLAVDGYDSLDSEAAEWLEQSIPSGNEFIGKLSKKIREIEILRDYIKSFEEKNKLAPPRKSNHPYDTLSDPAQGYINEELKKAHKLKRFRLQLDYPTQKYASVWDKPQQTKLNGYNEKGEYAVDLLPFVVDLEDAITRYVTPTRTHKKSPVFRFDSKKRHEVTNSDSVTLLVCVINIVHPDFKIKSHKALLEKLRNYRRGA